jgi:hypothetical protein
MAASRATQMSRRVLSIRNLFYIITKPSKPTLPQDRLHCIC